MPVGQALVKGLSFYMGISHIKATLLEQGMSKRRHCVFQP